MPRKRHPTRYGSALHVLSAILTARRRIATQNGTLRDTSASLDKHTWSKIEQVSTLVIEAAAHGATGNLVQPFSQKLLLLRPTTLCPATSYGSALLPFRTYNQSLTNCIANERTHVELYNQYRLTAPNQAPERSKNALLPILLLPR